MNNDYYVFLYGKWFNLLNFEQIDCFNVNHWQSFNASPYSVIEVQRVEMYFIVSDGCLSKSFQTESVIKYEPCGVVLPVTKREIYESLSILHVTYMP